jgi:hypothetical protein
LKKPFNALMKSFLAVNSKLNELVLMLLVVALKNGANQSNALNTFPKTAQKVQSVMLVNLVKSKFSDTTLTIPKNVAQFELANAPSNLAHSTTETQSATNTKLSTNLEILVVAARLACVILPLALKPKKITKKLTVSPVKKLLLLFPLLDDTVKKAPPKPTVAHNSNVFVTQTTAENQSLKTVPLNSDASSKKSQSLLISTVTNTCVAVMIMFALTNQNFAQPLQFATDHALF